MSIDPTSQLRINTQQQVANAAANTGAKAADKSSSVFAGAATADAAATTGAKAAEQSGSVFAGMALKDAAAKLGLSVADLMQFDINKDGTMDEKEFIKAINQYQAQIDSGSKNSTIPQPNKPLETE